MAKNEIYGHNQVKTLCESEIQLLFSQGLQTNRDRAHLPIVKPKTVAKLAEVIPDHAYLPTLNPENSQGLAEVSSARLHLPTLKSHNSL